MSELKKFFQSEPFVLESGHVLPFLQLGYTTIGKLNATRDNVIWIFHALTANSDPSEWWSGLVGEGKLFDQGKHFIVCVNMPGSCYGSIGPCEKSNASGECFYNDFPWFTIRDMVRAYQLLKLHLEIDRIQIGIGGSMGGQQLLEWAIAEPSLFRNIVPIATNAIHSPWAIAFNASQRIAIENDPTWGERDDLAGLEGMKLARSIALLSYRNYHTYQVGQQESLNEKLENFRSESYQRYQGEKLARRFNAYSYYFLSKSMDSHNVGRGRPGIEHALGEIKSNALVISISSDILFPPIEQQFLARHIPGAGYHSIDSNYGHDGFLLEFEQIAYAIERNLLEKETIIKPTEATIN